MPHNDEAKNTQKNYWKSLFHICKTRNTHLGFDGIIVTLSIQNILHEKQLHPAQSINAFKSQVEHITRQSPNTPLYFVPRRA